MDRFFNQPPRPHYKLTAKGANHLEQEVSRFEKMLEGITRVLAPGVLVTAVISIL